MLPRESAPEEAVSCAKLRRRSKGRYGHDRRAGHNLLFPPGGTRRLRVRRGLRPRRIVVRDETGQQILVLPSVTPYCTAVTWSPDGTTLAVGGGNYDTRVVLYRVRD